MMVVAHLGAADARKEAFGLVRTSLVMGICPFVVDAFRQEDRVQLVPMGGFVGMDNGVGIHALGDCCDRG